MLPMPLAEVKAKHEQFNASWLERGGQLTFYTCQHCSEDVQIRQPDEESVGPKGYWDSMMQCIYCGGMNFVAVCPDGRTRVA